VAEFAPAGAVACLSGLGTEGWDLRVLTWCIAMRCWRGTAQLPRMPAAGPASPALLPCCPQVKIMKEWDPTGRNGPRTPLPDVVKVHDPKEDEFVPEKPFVGKEQELAA
jgi:hypothetical protein